MRSAAWSNIKAPSPKKPNLICFNEDPCMVCFFRMSAVLQAVIWILISLTGLGIGEVGGRGVKERKLILPVGFLGRWREEGVEREVWYMRGESAFLLCRILRLQSILETQPRASIVWHKDDQPLENKRAIVTTEGHLNITKLVRRRGRASPETDEGVYRCLLVLNTSVKYVVSAPPITLHVAEIARHIVSNANVSAVEGSSVRLKCDITSEPPAVFYWHNSHGPLPQDTRFTEPTSGVLQITHLKKSDAGVYRCSATNELLNKTRVSEDIVVTVLDPPGPSPAFVSPSFLYPTSNQTLHVVENWSAILECLASGVPLPEITWRKKGVFDEVDDPWVQVLPERGRIHVSGQGNLHIRYVSPSDAGPYICIVASMNPTDGKKVYLTKEIKLVVVQYPRIESSLRNVTTMVAQTVRLNCSLHDRRGGQEKPPSSPYFPVPQVSWLKDGLPLRIDTRFELHGQTQLVIVNSGSRDTGVYQCIVTNEAGYATSWSYLLVNSSQDQPQPPYDLRSTVIGPMSALLEWSVDESIRPAIAGYSVHLTELGPNPSEVQAVVVNPQHEFNNLKPNTNYSFLVRVYTSSASDPSETAYFVTREAVPLDAPEFELKILSPSSLMVSWQPLPPQKARGTITMYKIQWRQRRKEYYSVEEVKPEILQYNLTHLNPGAMYKIRVLARTSIGYNSDMDWPWKSITMPALNHVSKTSLPMAPQLEVKLRDYESQGGPGIEITWQRHPHDQAPLEGYFLTYSRGEGPMSEDISLPPVATSYFIPGQDPDWYEINLVGYNEKGYGTKAVEVFEVQGPTKAANNSDTITHETAELPTIEKVILTPESLTIVHLSWEVSQVAHKPVAFYTIKQELVSASGLTDPDARPRLSRSTTKSVSMDGLVPFNTYEFRVRAHVSEGEFGPYSHPIRTNVLRNIPSAPKRVNFEARDASTIELRWHPAHMTLGKPNKYQIIYTNDKDLPQLQWIHKEVNGSIHSCTISGLVSNMDYWFRVRGCRDDVCGSYSEVLRGHIVATIVQDSSWNLPLIAGLTVASIVVLMIIFAVYFLKFRRSNSNIVLTTNANGTVRGVCLNEGDTHLGERNGLSDINGRDGDHVPMLSRIDTHIPTSPFDAKGGVRANGFANTKCPRVRGKDTQYGSSAGSKREAEMEELERLFPAPPRNGDLIPRLNVGDTTPLSTPNENPDKGGRPSPSNGAKEPPSSRFSLNQLSRGDSPSPPPKGVARPLSSSPPSGALLIESPPSSITSGAPPRSSRYKTPSTPPLE